MNLSYLVEELKLQNEGDVVLIKCGIFFIAIGEDAIILSDLLKLKLSCYRPEICKVGFPQNALKKYIDKLKELKIGFEIYDYTEEKTDLGYKDKKYKLLIKVNGKILKIDQKCKECIHCASYKGNKKEKVEEEKTEVMEKIHNSINKMDNKLQEILNHILEIKKTEEKLYDKK
jgi:vacuolar-type H+-ATPase subunit I/STV1